MRIARETGPARFLRWCIPLWILTLANALIWSIEAGNSDPDLALRYFVLAISFAVICQP